MMKIMMGRAVAIITKTGTINHIIVSSKDAGSYFLKTMNGNVGYTVTSNTKITNRKGNSMSFDMLRNGMKVKITFSSDMFPATATLRVI